MDVLIIGGGVAGLGAALFLSRRGVCVTVAEQQVGSIDKVCGEGIIPFGVDLLAELGLEDEVAQAGYPFRGIRYACGKRRAEGLFDEGQRGIGISRATLDALLRQRAINQGVTLLEGKRIDPGDAQGYDYVLAADGIHSRWGNSFGRQVDKSTRLGMRFRLNVPPPDMVEVSFFQGREVYLTPVDAHTLSVAMLVDRDPSAPKGEALRQELIGFFNARFPKYAHLEPMDIGMRGPIASRPRGRAPAIHLLGDAVQAFDPISGAGMSFALLCGKLAAEHLEDPARYWAVLKRHRRALDTFTNLILFFRGGGLRSQLMVRQLSKAKSSFNRILHLHDACSGLLDLGPRHSMALLRP